MSLAIFDIETNGIEDFQGLTDLHTIHCLVIRWPGEVSVFYGDKLGEGIDLLKCQDIIVGHNCISFDIPAIQKLWPDFKPSGAVRDTLVMSRLAWSDQRNLDFQCEDFPKNLVGSHSLKAWGHRLGVHKGEYGGGWDEMNDEMVEYCIRDTLVTQKLYELAEKRTGGTEAVLIEHDFQEIIAEQEKTGFAFDTIKAGELYANLVGKRTELKKTLSKSYPPQIERMKTPEYWVADLTTYATKTAAKKAGHKVIVKGPLKTKTVPFNPDSRLQIAEFLMKKHDWAPSEFTPSGQPQVDEKTLKALDIPEAKALVKYLTLSKRIGQLAEGKEAWLRVERKGRIHGKVNSNGTVTGRCTHSRPNLSATPAVSAEWGQECRSLFVAGPNRVLVGVDLSGLELRCLAHYMAKWDKGAYADLIMKGDIHTANQEAAGLPTRDSAKTLIYALIYGGGPQKIGSIVSGGVREGRNLTNRFLDRMPSLRQLRQQVIGVSKSRKYLIGLDGRIVPIRSPHSALNSLLQSCGSILTKKATIFSYQKFRPWNACSLADRGQVEVQQVAHVHDEIQYECEDKVNKNGVSTADRVGEASIQSIISAGEFFNLRCPLAGEYRIGKTWADTH